MAEIIRQTYIIRELPGARALLGIIRVHTPRFVYIDQHAMRLMPGGGRDERLR